MRKYNGKQRKESFRARSGSQQRAAVLLPRYLVWIKSYLFVYVSLSTVCTPSPRCTTVQRTCVHVFLRARVPYVSCVSLPPLFLLSSFYLLLSLYLSFSSLPPPPPPPSLTLSLSLGYGNTCSCVADDKQSHVHTITASGIRFADTRSRTVITAQKASKPNYRKNFIIFDGTEKKGIKVRLVLVDKLKLSRRCVRICTSD